MIVFHDPLIGSQVLLCPFLGNFLLFLTNLVVSPPVACNFDHGVVLNQVQISMSLQNEALIVLVEVKEARKKAMKKRLLFPNGGVAFAFESTEKVGTRKSPARKENRGCCSFDSQGLTLKSDA